MKKIHSCYFKRGDLFTLEGREYRFGYYEYQGPDNNGYRYSDFNASAGNEWFLFPAGKYLSDVEPVLSDRLLVFWQTIIIPLFSILIILFFCLTFYLMAVRESGSRNKRDSGLEMKLEINKTKNY